MTVFISHSSRDHAAVRSLVQHLQTGHESVWIDQSLIGGEAWWQRILHQIRSCTVFVVALSNSCLQSKPCRAEIDYAKALGLPLLPVIIGDVDSYRIDPIFTVQSVDFRNPDAASAAALIAAVRERAAERKELPDPLPEPPAVPYEYLQRLGVAIDSPEELSPTEQTTILADLRQALRQEDDESVREDIRRLLGALRRRSEVTHANVEEIDDLLRRFPSAARWNPPAPPQWQPQAPPAAKVGAPQGGSPAMFAQPPPPYGAGPTKSRSSKQKIVVIAAGLAVLVVVIAVVAYMLNGRTSPGSVASKPTTTTTIPAAPPVPVAELDGLLLNPDQVSNAMGATALAVINTSTKLVDDATSIAQPECRTVNDSGEAAAYSGSGWSALRRQQLQQPPQGGARIDYFVDQAVVLFPSADNAAKFVAGSATRWPACANRTYVVTSSGGGTYRWTAGPVSNTDGMLSVTDTQEASDGYTCQRALTATNNIVVDVNTCRHNVNETAVDIARQIAAKVARL